MPVRPSQYSSIRCSKRIDRLKCLQSLLASFIYLSRQVKLAQTTVSEYQIPWTYDPQYKARVNSINSHLNSAAVYAINHQATTDRL